MLNGNVFYWAIIRKTIVGFGNLFSNIYIDRKQGNSETGTTVQRLQVPIAYAPKEKWLVRIDQDPNLENNVYVTLPRISFEITGYQYDSQRKLNKMNKINCIQGGTGSNMFAPVPYILDIQLYILTKTQEDGLQIIEQILPTFTPEYTLSIKAVPEMNIIQDVPITLNGVSVSDEYDGDFQTRRFVTHTLSFSAKVNLFGAVSSTKRILKVDTDVGQDPQFVKFTQKYTATGNITTGNINETWEEDL